MKMGCNAFEFYLIFIALNFGLTIQQQQQQQQQQSQDQNYYFTQRQGRFPASQSFNNPITNGFYPSSGNGADLQRNSPGSYHEQTLYIDSNIEPQQYTTPAYFPFSNFPETNQQNNYYELPSPPQPRPFNVPTNNGFQYTRPTFRQDFQQNRNFIQNQQTPSRRQQNNPELQLNLPDRFINQPTSPVSSIARKLSPYNRLSPNHQQRPFENDPTGFESIEEIDNNDNINTNINNNNNNNNNNKYYRNQPIKSNEYFTSQESISKNRKLPTSNNFNKNINNNDSNNIYNNYNNNNNNRGILTNDTPSQSLPSSPSSTLSPFDLEEIIRRNNFNFISEQNRMIQRQAVSIPPILKKEPLFGSEEILSLPTTTAASSTITQNNITNNQLKTIDNIEYVYEEDLIDDDYEEDPSLITPPQNNIQNSKNNNITINNITENINEPVNNSNSYVVADSEPIILHSNFFLPANEGSDPIIENDKSDYDQTTVKDGTTGETTTEDYEYEYDDDDDDTIEDGKKTTENSAPIKNILKDLVEISNTTPSNDHNLNETLFNNQTHNGNMADYGIEEILEKTVVSVVTTKSVVNGSTSNPSLLAYTKIPINYNISTETPTENNTISSLTTSSSLLSTSTESWVVVASVQTSRSVSGARFLPFAQVEQEEKKQTLSELDTKLADENSTSSEDVNYFNNNDETNDNDDDFDVTTLHPLQHTTQKSININLSQQLTNNNISTESIIDKLDRVQSELSSDLLIGKYPLINDMPDTSSSSASSASASSDDNSDGSISQLPQVIIRKFLPKTTTHRTINLKNTTNNIGNELILDNIDNINNLSFNKFKTKSINDFQQRFNNRTENFETVKPIRNSTIGRSYKNNAVEQQLTRNLTTSEHNDGDLNKLTKSGKTSTDNATITNIDMMNKPVAGNDNIKKFIPFKYKLRKNIEQNRTSSSSASPVIPTITGKSDNTKTNQRIDDVTKFLPPNYKQQSQDDEHSKTIPFVIPIVDDVTKFLPSDFKSASIIDKSSSSSSSSSSDISKKQNEAPASITIIDDISKFLPPGFKTSKDSQKDIATTASIPIVTDISKFLPPGFKLPTAKNQTEKLEPSIPIIDDIDKFLPPGFKLPSNNNKSENIKEIPPSPLPPVPSIPIVNDISKFLPPGFKLPSTDNEMDNVKVIPAPKIPVVDDISKFLPPGFKLPVEKETDTIQILPVDDISKFLPPGFKLTKEDNEMKTTTSTPLISTADDITKFLPPGFKIPKKNFETSTQPVIQIIDDISKFLPPDFKSTKSEEATTGGTSAVTNPKTIIIDDVSKFLPPGYKLNKYSTKQDDKKISTTILDQLSTTTVSPTATQNSGLKVVFPKGFAKRPGVRLTTHRPINAEGPPQPDITIRKGPPTRATTEFTGWPSPPTTPFSIEKLLAQQNAQAIDISELLGEITSTTTEATTTTTTTTTVKPTQPGLCRHDCDLAGTIKIVDGVKWTPELLDHNTDEWKNLAREVEAQLNEVYSKAENLQKWYKKIRIDSFSKGSVLVDYFVELSDIPHDINTLEIRKMFHNALTEYVPVPESSTNGNDDSIETVIKDDNVNNSPQIKETFLLGNFVLDPISTDFIVIPKVIPPLVSYEDEHSLIPQWAIAVIVIGMASLIFVILFGIGVFINRHKKSKKKATTLTADMLNELNKNHMGGFENYGNEDVYNIDNWGDDIKQDIKPKRFTNSMHGSSASNIYDSWRSQRNADYYYDSHHFPDKGTSREDQYGSDEFMDSHSNNHNYGNHPHHNNNNNNMGMYTYNPKKFRKDYDTDF